MFGGDKYQFFPPLPPDQYEELKADIAAVGLQHAICVDTEGNILDGFHRYRACQELGLEKYRVEVRTDLETHEEKVEFAVRANGLRRHPTPEERRPVAQRLSEEEGWSQRRIAAMLGVSHMTVCRDLDAVVTNVTPDPQDRVIGKDGKSYPAHREDKYDRIPLFPKDAAEQCINGGSFDKEYRERLRVIPTARPLKPVTSFDPRYLHYYRTIVASPDWPGRVNSVQPSLAEGLLRAVEALAASDLQLYLFVPDHHLSFALALLDECGLQFGRLLTWMTPVWAKQSDCPWGENAIHALYAFSGNQTTELDLPGTMYLPDGDNRSRWDSLPPRIYDTIRAASPAPRFQLYGDYAADGFDTNIHKEDLQTA